MGKETPDAEKRGSLLTDDLKALNRKTRDIWNRNARFWDERMGEGNDFHRLLVAPSQERLLGLKKGELVLDAACGNGQFARRMVELGARVVAFDISERLIQRAIARTTEHADRIRYLVMDAMDRKLLLALGQGRFDAAVCTMAVMDIPDIEPLVRALSRLLKPNGRFVLSIVHPCFNSAGVRLAAEEETVDGRLVTSYSVRVLRYIKPTVTKGQAMVGQPMPQYYFDRPLSVLFDICFRAGFVLDGLEEPVLDERAEAKRAVCWGNIREIPPVLVARMRPRSLPCCDCGSGMQS